MVDSVKNYGTTGVAATVELGKKGPKIDGTDSSQISIVNTNGALVMAEIANGTVASHAVTKAQLDAAAATKVQFAGEEVVSYDSGSRFFLFTIPAGSRVLSTTVDKITNWTGYDAATDIAIGTLADPASLFSGFTPDGSQHTSDSDVVFAVDTPIYATVTAGTASSGTASVKVLFYGNAAQVDQVAPGQ
jgi:hypothetical protein